MLPSERWWNWAFDSPKYNKEEEVGRTAGRTAAGLPAEHVGAAPAPLALSFGAARVHDTCQHIDGGAASIQSACVQTTHGLRDLRTLFTTSLDVLRRLMLDG
jgi:hypothetical protein